MARFAPGEEGDAVAKPRRVTGCASPARFGLEVIRGAVAVGLRAINVPCGRVVLWALSARSDTSGDATPRSAEEMRPLCAFGVGEACTSRAISPPEGATFYPTPPLRVLPVADVLRTARVEREQA